ncbi:hypothetical protein [Dyadobacter sp. CY312]|uniref:hypothetical protein n=1 Tax=Dyadobacter sp. CY312 TaxID=2907303 RepID=UPI001F19B361|nr:hypothetical protein [Dyadobacter sp. CY312]MCE7041391.1 hypothetical protein [Dyadobacter sp. CY312]
MKKQPKLSFKVYSNNRLQPVSFHGQPTSPLYIQVIYNKKPIYFKSSYFDQLSHPKYAIQSILGHQPPVSDQIVALEERLLGHLTNKYSDDFQLDTFKREYYLLSYDLLFTLEEGFQRYLTTFFQDQGLPVLSFLVAAGGTRSTSEHILNDLKISLDKQLFRKLTEGAVHYAPPYIPLCAFLRSSKRQIVPILSVQEWTSVNFKSDFKAFLHANYPGYDFDQIEQYTIKLMQAYQK